MTEQTQDITAVDNLVNNPQPKTGVPKYDWFKNDLAGMNANIADVYAEGYSPEDHVMHEQSKYWNDPLIRAPFEQKFGADAENKFKEVYDMSSKRFQGFKDVRNDLTGTSAHKFIAPGKVERKLEALGYGTIDRSKPLEITNRARDPWGAELLYRTLGHAEFTPPKHSIRVGAEKNGVLDQSGNLVPLENYLEENPGANLVYATDKQGAPLLKNGLNYLRPLQYGEERNPNEEMYGGKLNTYFGMNGIDTPDGYWWKFTGKNLMNFSADVLDSGAEFLKMLDNLWQTGDQSAWDKSMTEFQNDVNSLLFVPTSEAGMSKWYSTEGLVDGVTQVAGQLAGMMAIGRTVSGLSTLAKMGPEFSARAGSAAGRLWMASLASDDFAKEARRMGFSPKEQQLFYSLYMLGMYQIAGLSDAIVNPAKTKVVQQQILGSMINDLKTAAKTTGGKMTPSGIWQAVKNGQNSLKMALATESGVAGYGAAGLNEAAEEVSEVFFDKGFKEGVNHIYNPLAAKFTGDTRRDVRFNVNWENLPTELAQSATLGFAGGMLARRIIKHDALNPTTLLGYGAIEGGYDKLERMWDKMYSKGQIIPGGKNVDVLGKEIKDPERYQESREYLVYKAIKNEIAGARALWDGMKLRQAFTSTEEALKFVGDSNLVKQTSIGKDIASRLSEMTQLEADINTAKITETEEVKKATQRIADIKQELEDMKAGKYAGKYLAEGLFNMYTFRLRDRNNESVPEGEKTWADSVKMISFDRFDQLEKSLAAHMTKVNEIMQAENIPLEEILLRKPSITQEKHTDAIAKLAEKYEIGFNEDNEIESGTEANIKKYNEERQILDDLLYADPPTAASHFLRTANTDGSPGKKFEEMLQAEDLRAADDSNVYDDVETIEQIREGIFERMSQLEAIIHVNSTFNALAEKGNLGDKRTEIPVSEMKDILIGLGQQIGPATALLEFAKANRESFFNSSLKAWKGQVQEMAGRLVKASDTVFSTPEFAELKQRLDPIMVAVANAEGDDDTRLKEIFKAEQTIHDYFAGSPKEGVTRVWQVMGLTDRTAAINEMSHGGVYIYLKSLINMDPKRFRDAYLTVLNNATESKITPFPEQYFSIFVTTASLMGGYNPIETFSDTPGPNGLVNEANLTETVFLNGDQGSGKTFVSSMALRTSQILRGWGQVAVIAKQEELRTKNFKYLGNFNVDRNPGISKPMSGEELLTLLNSEEVSKISLIYIDEVTMYSRDELAKIDARAREINSTVKDPTKTLKILVTGDTHQATVMNKENTESYSLDSRTLTDRTPRTRFSFRTGNQDILGFLRHLNNLFDTFRSSLRPPMTSFKYSNKEMAGLRAVEDIDKVIADMLKRKEIAGKDLVIITTPERKAELRKKHEKSLSDDQLLTPMEAQGRQWKYVIVDLPLDFSKSDEGSIRMLRDLISASGRASNMLVIKNQPEIGIVTGEAESKLSEPSFSEEQLSQLRTKHVSTLTDAGVSEVNIQTEPGNRIFIPTQKEEELFVYNSPLSPELRDKMRSLMLSITPKAGHSTFLAHSVFTTRIEYDENGKARIVNDSAELQSWKKQLFYPEQFQETEFDVDKTIFELRLESSGVPSGLVNKPGAPASTGKPTLVIYAKLQKDGEAVGEMQVLTIADIKESDLPNVKITMTEQQSALFLQELRKDLPRAEKDTVNQFKKETDARLRGEKVDKKSIIALNEFQAKNSFFNYASRVHYVTRGVGETAGKLPFMFYSPSLTTAQIDEILFKNQRSQALLSETADSSFTLLEGALSELAQQSVFPIALDGGQQVPVNEFLKQLYEDKKVGKDIKTEHRLKNKAATRFKDYIFSKFKMKADEMDDTALAELEAMKVTGMSAQNKYFRKLIISHFKPTGDFKQTSPDTDVEVKQPTKKGTVKIKKPKAETMRLHYNPMLAELYEHSIGETADAVNANKIIAELSESKGPFPHGVFKDSTAEKGGTENMDTTFAKLSNYSAENSKFSVSNLLVPAMPVFQVSEDFIKSIINDGDMSAYDVSIRVTYKPEQAGAQIQLDPAENKAVRITVDAQKDAEGYSHIDTSAGKTYSNSTIHGLMATWFSDYADSMWIEEFAGYFKKHIIYDNLFRLHDNNPQMITQQEIHRVLTDLKRQFNERMKIQKVATPTQKEAALLLRTNVPSDRGRYYDYIIAHEFDFLLRHYFGSGISVVDGQYRYTTTDYVQGTVPDENDVSHMDTGNDLVKIHFFAMPVFTNTKKTDSRLPNKEDYYRIVRMVRDNNITTLSKARAFFGVTNPLTPNDLLKQSFYLRFLAPKPSQIGGVSYHSLMSAARAPITQEMAASHVTGMLSFLSTGSESQYTRSTFNFLNESTVSGRSVDIDPSRFRSDLEDSIKSVHKTMTEKKSLLKVTHRAEKGDKPEAYVIKFPTYGRNTATWEVRRKGSDVFINNTDGSPIHVPDLGVFMKALGLGEMNKKFYNRIYKSLQFRNSLFEIGKFLSQDDITKPIFTGGALNDWINTSDTIADIRQVEGAYGRMTLDGQYQELVTLGYPYVRTNQKVKELQTTATVLSNNAFVKNELAVTGFLIKDGFETKDGRRKRPNSKMTASEQLFYDFNELYLGSLAKYRITDAKQRAIFNPITFSDKGRDGVIQVEGEIIPRRAGKVDMERIRNRAIESVNTYYKDISRGVINTWVRVLNDENFALTATQPFGHILPVTEADSHVVLQQRMRDINTLIEKLTPMERAELVKSDLVSELMYVPKKARIVDPDGRERVYRVVGRIKDSLIDWVDPVRTQTRLMEKFNEFNTSFGKRYHFPLGDKLKDANMDIQEARDSYFWNWVWVSNGFNSLWVGPQEQYKSGQEYYDMVKRASQISTNRQRVITRSEDWQSGIERAESLDVDGLISSLGNIDYIARVNKLRSLGIIDNSSTMDSGRRIIITNINGVKIPFYRSKYGTSGKVSGKWYPFFGFGKTGPNSDENSWMVKGTIAEIERNYGSQNLADMSRLINTLFDWDVLMDRESISPSPYAGMKKISSGEINTIVYGRSDSGIVNGEGQIDIDIKNIVQKVDTRGVKSRSFDLHEGRKMGRFSRVAIISDFSVIVPTISGGEVDQKIFDGASFFNAYGKLQMQYSYGNDAGFKVGANIKPIGNYLNPETGAARYDKYASFEITQQMIDQGHPFIKKINEMMMKSVTFPTPIVKDGAQASNLFELDAWGKSKGMTEAQIYDVMVENGVQDYFLREITFDSSVKNGQSNINDFGNDMELFQNNNAPLDYSLRDNAEWGLILNASKESNDNDARIATQFVSTFLQSIHTEQEAVDIMQAIQRIGDIFRSKINTADESYMDNLRKAVAKRDEIGLLSQLINSKAGNVPKSNRLLMNALHSNLSSWMSDESIRFRIFGGQQVIAPASGVWAVVDEVVNGVAKTRLARAGELGRQLRGFNATRTVGDNVESILTTPLWTELKNAVAAKNNQLATQLRNQLRQELASGGWKIEVPEIVISPTHFHAFGIPEGTNIEDVTPELFMQIDSEKLHDRFDPSIMEEKDRVAYLTGRDGNAATPEQLAAMRQPYIDKVIAERAARGEYDKRTQEFEKSLNIIMGRIPATFFQSLTPLKVVGFAHGADNTAYVHPDILVLQGADHDIDKGNIMSFEPSKNGEIKIPNSLVEAGDDPVALKNFIVKRMMDGLNNPKVAIESTLPTSTINIDDTIRQMGLSPNAADSSMNPISNNDSFVRGQSGKQNIGIHASGLKTFSSVFHSAIRRGRTYSNYVPVSAALSKQGQPFKLSGIDGGVEGLIMFGEAIQASVDNAKDPKLGLLGWDAANGRIVNALAMFGYSPQQITAFLKDPAVQAVYDRYRSNREFFATNKDFYTSMMKIVSEAPNTPEIADLRYLLGVGQEMMELTRVVGINREIPNSIFGVVQMNKAFSKLTGMKLYQYINSKESAREAMAEEMQQKIDAGTANTSINAIEILNDNFHLFSYLQSMDKLDNIMRGSNMYTKLVQAADVIPFYDEDEFRRFEDMMYGLAVDAYIASKGDSKYITMNGKLYDMTSVSPTANAQSRIEFMKDFPTYFKSLNARPESLQSMMDIVIQNDHPVLKFQGNWRDYPVERKVKARLLMQSLEKDAPVPSGDTSVSNMMFMYSLIKDKGNVTSSSLTDVFDYNNSEFASFDKFVDTQFGSPYLNSPADLTDLYVTFTGKYMKDVKKDEYKQAFMKQNAAFIPYTNDLTINDKIATDGPVVNIQGFSEPTGGPEGAGVVYTIKPGEISQTLEKLLKAKKSKVYIDSETKKAVSFPVNRRMLTNLADMLSRKYNITAHVLSASEMKTRFGHSYGSVKGAAIGGEVFINADIATIDTPLHEFSHVWLDILKGENRQMYNQIINLSLNHAYADRIRQIYPELDDNGVAGEVFATLTGIYSASRANEKALSSMNQGFFAQAAQVFKDFMDWLNRIFLDIFGMKPAVNDSLLSIIDKVGESMLSTSTFGLSSYDKQVLKVLGVRTQTAEDPLSIIRDRLKYQNRFEKICA